MKLLKINTTITTNAGFDIAEGAICKVAESLFKQYDTRDNGDVPLQVALQVYASDQARSGKKKIINHLLESTEFPLLVEVDIPLFNYENTKTETLIVNAVKAKLDVLFPGNVAIITV